MRLTDAQIRAAKDLGKAFVEAICDRGKLETGATVDRDVLYFAIGLASGSICATDKEDPGYAANTMLTGFERTMREIGYGVGVGPDPEKSVPDHCSCPACVTRRTMAGFSH